MRTRRRLMVALVALSLVTIGSPASATPPHGEGGHTHHVHTPAGCIAIDRVTFVVDDRGLHRGGNSSGFERGIWHGPCH